MGAPASHTDGSGLVYPLDASVGDLASCCRVWTGDDFPLSGLVREAVADLKLHRQNRSRR